MFRVSLAFLPAASGGGADWLNCHGAAFAPQWAQLNQLTMHLSTEQIRPLPPVIVKFIEDLEPSCQARQDVASLLAWTGEKPETDYEAMDSLRWWINSSYEVRVQEGSAFCLYGCITVLFLLAFNELAWISATPHEPSDAEAEQSLQYLFVTLHYAKSLLGDHSTLDLISSSTWPADLPSKITQLFLQAEELVMGTTPPAIVNTGSALELSHRWQPCDPYLHQGCFPSSSTSDLRLARKDGAPLVMLLIGEHAPFANTVWQCIQSAAVALSVSLRPIFAGAFYGCKGLPSGCKDDTTKDWFRSWMTRYLLEGDEALKAEDMSREAFGLVKAIQANPDPDASRPDFVLCGDTALFCYLTRQVAGTFHDTPALHMYGMVLLQYVPHAWRHLMLEDFGKSWKDKAIHEPAGVQIEVLGLQLQWQMGIAIPYVPSSGTSDTAGVLYEPSGVDRKRLLVLKSSFFALAPGRVFDTVLRRLGRDVPAIDWHHWGSENKVDPKDAKFLNFATMASYSCALYVAPEFSQLLLRDIYGIGLPILAPDITWHQRLLQHIFASWGQMHNEHNVGRMSRPSGLQEEVFRAAEQWRFLPFYDPKEHPPEHLKFWLPLAEVHRYPHIVYFTSLIEMIQLVETLDLNAVSLRMQAQSRIITGNVRRFYRRALSQLAKS